MTCPCSSLRFSLRPAIGNPALPTSLPYTQIYHIYLISRKFILITSLCVINTHEIEHPLLCSTCKILFKVDILFISKIFHLPDHPIPNIDNPRHVLYSISLIFSVQQRRAKENIYLYLENCRIYGFPASIVC
jgi:hypothetical protein